MIPIVDFSPVLQGIQPIIKILRSLGILLALSHTIVPLVSSGSIPLYLLPVVIFKLLLLVVKVLLVVVFRLLLLPRGFVWHALGC